MAKSRGCEQWARIHNLKQAAKTMNFITEHKIEQYTDLTAKIAEIQTESEQAADALKSVEKRIADMAVLIKNVSTFQKTNGYSNNCSGIKEKYGLKNGIFVLSHSMLFGILQMVSIVMKLGIIVLWVYCLVRKQRGIKVESKKLILS